MSFLPMSSLVTTPGLEILFIEVEEWGLAMDCDLCPSARLEWGKVRWKFNADLPYSITARSLMYRTLSDECLGFTTRYCPDQIFDKGGTPCIVDF